MSNLQPRQLRFATHLFLDFDGTITIGDTTSVIGNISERSRSRWQFVIDGYMQDYGEFKRTPFEWRDHTPSEYSRWLNSRKSIEVASAQRAQDCGMFEGLTDIRVREAVAEGLGAGKIRLRADWQDVFLLARKQGEPRCCLEIISVNWSSYFIRQVLAQAGSSRSSPSTQSDFAKYIEAMGIHSNEIWGLREPSGSSGRLVEPSSDLRTSGDKLRVLKARQAHEQTLSKTLTQEHSEDVLSVYIGDSSTDFEALCEADLGIWLYDAPEEEYREKFREVFHPLDYEPQPLSLLEGEAWRPKDLREKDAPLIYWAPNFHAILEVLTVPT